MERENQIEIANEIYKTLFWEADCSLSGIDCTIIADLLVSKGYRLASEVALEVIELFTKMIKERVRGEKTTLGFELPVVDIDEIEDIVEELIERFEVN